MAKFRRAPGTPIASSCSRRRGCSPSRRPPRPTPSRPTKRKRRTRRPPLKPISQRPKTRPKLTRRRRTRPRATKTRSRTSPPERAPVVHASALLSLAHGTSHRGAGRRGLVFVIFVREGTAANFVDECLGCADNRVANFGKVFDEARRVSARHSDEIRADQHLAVATSTGADADG